VYTSVRYFVHCRITAKLYFLEQNEMRIQQRSVILQSYAEVLITSCSFFPLSQFYSSHKRCLLLDDESAIRNGWSRFTERKKLWLHHLHFNSANLSRELTPWNTSKTPLSDVRKKYIDPLFQSTIDCKNVEHW